MQKLFSDLEGLRIAMALEEKGRDYYRKVSENLKNVQQKATFMLLMKEEIHHYEMFSEMFKQLSAQKEAHTEEYMFDPEVSRYLTVITDQAVFPPNAGKTNFGSLQEIVAEAIQAEKDSILFYDELARHAKFEEARAIFLKLKSEEQKHIVKLREMFSDVK